MLCRFCVRKNIGAIDMYDCCMCYWHAAINAYLLPRDMWCNREGKYVFVRSLEQEVAEVVEYGKGHEQEQQCHADCLGALHKLVAWFATCNDFDEEENTCPPSSAGIGSMFIKASMREMNAVSSQNGTSPML